MTVIIVILASCVAYASWRTYRLISEKEDPCAGCEGCELKHKIKEKRELSLYSDLNYIKPFIRDDNGNLYLKNSMLYDVESVYQSIFNGFVFACVKYTPSPC